MIILFLFQGALIFVFAAFTGQVILADLPLAKVRLMRNLCALATVLLTIISNLIYAKSLPPDKPMLHASLPAGWVFILFASVTLGLTFAIKRRTAKEARKGK